jgi:hypothetical protein
VSAAQELSRVFLAHAGVGEEPVMVPPAGLAAIQRHLDGFIHTPSLLEAVSALVRLAEFVAREKRSPRCGAELLAISESVLKLARALGDPATEGYFELRARAARSLDGLIAKYQRRAPPEHWYRPVTVDLELTHRCNLRCEPCAIINDVERGYDGLSGDDIVAILKSFEGTSVFSYSLMGGEAMLRVDDICRILSEVDLDFNRIVTNAKVFSSRARARSLLERLALAGLGTRNKHLRPMFSISIGIQTEAGTPLRYPAYLIAEALELFGDKVVLILNVLPPKPGTGPALIREFVEEYYRAIGAHFPWERIETATILGMEYTPRAEKAGAVGDRFVTLEEWFQRDEAALACPNFGPDRGELHVAPRCLVRADRGFYACSCFGYVARVGQWRGSFAPLLDRANGDVNLRRVMEGGIESLYAARTDEDPSLRSVRIPFAASVCDACKALREPGAPIATRESLPILV